MVTMPTKKTKPSKQEERLMARVRDWESTIATLEPRQNPLGFKKPGSLRK